MTAGCNILVVGDDPDACQEFSLFLEEAGYRVVSVSTISDGHWKIEKEDFQLVLLCLGLPDGDGLALARSIVSKKYIALIIVSGRTTQADRVVGLEIGADDYVTKPFDDRELLARVRSVLRRLSQVRNGDKNPQSHVINEIQFSGWRLDMSTHELCSPVNTIIHLTNHEFKLLSLLARNSNKAISRDEIKKELVGVNWLPDDRSIDTAVSRIRKKVEYDPSRPRFIATVRGVGYRFVPKTVYSYNNPIGCV